jgi:hypothetical protein
MLDIDGYGLPERRMGRSFLAVLRAPNRGMEVRLPNDRDGVLMCGASIPVSEDSDR